MAGYSNTGYLPPIRWPKEKTPRAKIIQKRARVIEEQLQKALQKLKHRKKASNRKPGDRINGQSTHSGK